MNIVNTIQTRFMVSFKINVPYCNLILISKFSIWKLYIKKGFKILSRLKATLKVAAATTSGVKSEPSATRKADDIL